MIEQPELPLSPLAAVYAEIPGPKPLRWNYAKSAGLIVLCCLWAMLFAGTWARWGSVTIDCGREMYVPWELSQGKVLYKDIWYPYMPLGPYLNSFLFRLFGAKLAVLYWAGSLSALGCAVLLYLTGMRMSSWQAGWTAAAVVLVESFAPSFFCFPLPYSFGGVYGALADSLCLWFCINAVFSPSLRWVFGAASAAAAAFLAKVEFGTGCYVAVGVLILATAIQARSTRRLLTGFLTALPGVAVCGATLVWMVSLGGREFLVQENLMGTPSTYFMRTYGAVWLRITGMAFDGKALVRALGALLVFLLYFALRAVWSRYGAGWRVFLIGLGALLALATAMLVAERPATLVARALFLPPAMVFLLFAVHPLLLWIVWRNRFAKGSVAMLVLASGSAVTAMRCLVLTNSTDYSIYYNGPVILSFLLLAGWAAFPKGPDDALSSRPAELLLFLAVLLTACFPVAEKIVAAKRTWEPLQSDRGLIYLPPGMPQAYNAAIRLMKDAARDGKYVLSVPEDASLYFLSGTHCPTRIYSFTPGVTAPGKMMETLIKDISKSRTGYLVWSNRTFPEYGTPEFGVDFDRPLGDYFRSHFRPVASLPKGLWSATIWERK